MLISENLELRTKEPEYGGHWVFSNDVSTDRRIDVWFAKEWVGLDAPGAISVRIGIEGIVLAEGEAAFSLDIRKRGQTRREWVSDELGSDKKPLVSGVYLPAELVGDPLYHLKLFARIDESLPRTTGTLGPSRPASRRP